jgi:mRNA-degrading endonuclease RelE of RelBE toxin-antitoxin system
MYELIVERSAEKDLKKLSSEVRPRAIAAMLALG